MVRTLYFLALILTAIAMGAALAHLFELPNKISIGAQDYLTVQRNYDGWWMVGLFFPAAFFAVIALMFALRGTGLPFVLAAAAVLLLAGEMIAFWGFTAPANRSTENWTMLPDNWEAWRAQWEYSHAVRGPLPARLRRARAVRAKLAAGARLKTNREGRDPMTKVRDEVLAANEDYAGSFGDKGELPMPPARRFAILTCMDARLDPARFAGLAEGDAHVIRNAGGRASDDAIRSLVISHKLLGTKEWFVVHHTDCGMETFTDEIMRGLLRQSLDTAEIGPDGWKDVGQGPGSTAGDHIDWLTISDQAESVTADVKRIRAHPLVPQDVPVYGYIYDVRSGRLIEVPEATEAGKA